GPSGWSSYEAPLLEGTGALVREQPALALDSAAVAGKRPVGADHAVARDDDTDGVRAVGGAHGAHGGGCADAPRERLVRDRLPRRDRPQRGPHPALERRAARIDRDGVERAPVAREVRGETAR